MVHTVAAKTGSLGTWLSGLSSDLRQVQRLLVNAKQFTALATLTFALGIGVNIAVFSIVDRLMFRPLPYADADRLVQVHQVIGMLPDGEISPSMMPSEITSVLESEASSFEGLAWELGWTDTTVPTPGTNPLYLAAVTPNLLDVLGVRPILGRSFDQQDKAGSEMAVILSYESWTTRFGANRNLLAAAWRNGRRSYRVVGVLPQGFFLPSSRFRERLDGIFVTVGQAYAGVTLVTIAPVGRLRPGVSVSRAQAEVDVLMHGHSWKLPMLRRQAAEHRLSPVTVQPLRSGLSMVVGPYLWVVSGAVWLVLLATAINLSVLLLVRSRARQTNAAVRASLGASPARLVRLALLESLAIALIGTAAAIVVCVWTHHWIVAVVPAGLRGLTSGSLDTRILAIAVSVAVLSALVAGTLPARTAVRLDVLAVLRGQGSRARRQTVFGASGISLSIQAAFGVVVMVGAAMTVPRFVSFLVRPSGFEARDLFTVSVNHDWARGSGSDRQTERISTIIDLLSALPNVLNASPTPLPPFADSWNSGFWADRGLEGGQWFIGTDMFKTLRTPIRAGREFSRQDFDAGADVVMLNETGAKVLWPSAPLPSVLGKSIAIDGRTANVIGVAQDIRTHPGSRAVPALFLPLTAREAASRQTALSVVLRMAVGAVPDGHLMTSSLNARFPQNGVTISSVATQLAPILDRPRFLAVLFGSLAAISVLLGAVGVYAVASLELTLRQRDVSIHLALGASRRRLYGLILGRILASVLLGVAVGLGGAWASARLVPWMSAEVQATPGTSYVAAAIIVAATAIVAVWPRIRRAVRTSPLTGMRI